MTPGSARVPPSYLLATAPALKPTEDAHRVSLAFASKPQVGSPHPPLEQPHRLHPTANIVIQVVTGQLPTLTQIRVAHTL